MHQTMQNEKTSPAAAFGERLRECRGTRRTIDLAPHVGKTQQTWNGWERGRTEPDLATLAELCRLFDVSADWLIGLSPVRRRASESGSAAVTAGANSPAIATNGGSASMQIGADAALSAHLMKQVEDLTAEKNRLLALVETLAAGGRANAASVQ